MIAVSRLFLDNIDNIQVAWGKVGLKMTQLALLAGANDLAGTMFTDDVTGNAGASGSDYLDPKDMERIVSDLGRAPPAEDNIIRARVKRWGISPVFHATGIMLSSGSVRPKSETMRSISLGFQIIGTRMHSAFPVTSSVNIVPAKSLAPESRASLGHLQPDLSPCDLDIVEVVEETAGRPRSSGGPRGR